APGATTSTSVAEAPASPRAPVAFPRCARGGSRDARGGARGDPSRLRGPASAVASSCRAWRRRGRVARALELVTQWQQAGTKEGLALASPVRNVWHREGQ